VINEKLPKLQELVMSGQQPCSAVCAQALRQCHRLLNEAETKMDQAIQAANQAATSIDARAAFQASQAEAAQASRLQALELGETEGGGVE
jgi:hypothetical protein